MPSTPSHDTATRPPPHAGCLSSCSCWSLQRTSPSLPRESAGNPSGMCTAAAARQRPGRLRPRTRALPRPACQGRHAAPRCAGSARRLTALPKPPPQILPVVAVPIRVPPRVPPHALRRPAPTTPARRRCAALVPPSAGRPRAARAPFRPAKVADVHSARSDSRRHGCERPAATAGGGKCSSQHPPMASLWRLRAHARKKTEGRGPRKGSPLMFVVCPTNCHD